MRRRPRVQTGLRACLSLLLSLGLWSCASFSRGNLPERRLEDLERAGKLPAITYELIEASSNTFGASSPSALANARIEPLFRRLFVESEQKAGPSGLHLDMYFRETARNPMLTLGLGFFFIASLGFFPAYGEDELYLEVKLRRDGESVRQYSYVESKKTWFHWFVLPWAFSNDPGAVTASVFDNMILNLVHDLQRDLPGLVPGS